MEFGITDIDGLMVIKHDIHGDDRGYFVEDYNQNDFVKNGIHCTFVQDNRSFSKYGTLRGLHYQAGQNAQSKLVRVLQGKVLDIALDLRKNSKTFGKHFSIELKENDGISFFIPKGFAHGFVVLSKTALFCYKCDNFYNKSSDRGVLFSDPILAIDWQINHSSAILSEKDKILPKLSEIKDQDLF